ncbi:C39 family peptidase [Sphingomonas xanthus]|uniref:C39 family peptidase n=1 Tax=Sphingomonas xanthus TaxID=2594473 RepID=A0A516INQ0_9SPHN|nr:C39 family peptidase [Sphingomonas xanthus]QDP18497.1 C39 family peptidase [Sphingomonas xanthus]
MTLTVCALAMAGCATSSPSPPAIWMAQVSQGAPVVDVGVKSWKALKFTNLVRQQTDFSCGAAAMATVFNFGFGHKTTERQILVNMLKVADPEVVREKGFSLLDMKNYAKQIGYAAEGYEVDYEALTNLKVPGIALINLNGYKHFVVIRKADAHYVHVGDPALGNRTMKREDFLAAWNKVVFVMVGEGLLADSALLNPKPPLSARRLFESRSPVFNADLADFGFGPSFNFGL